MYRFIEGGEGEVAPPLSLLSKWTRTNLAVYKREELGL